MFSLLNVQCLCVLPISSCAEVAICLLRTNQILWFVTNLILYKAEELLLIPWSCKKATDDMLWISSYMKLKICCPSYLVQRWWLICPSTVSTHILSIIHRVHLSSFSKSGGVNDRLHIYPVRGIFCFPWHWHHIEGADGFQCLLRKTLTGKVLPKFRSEVAPVRIRTQDPLYCPVVYHQYVVNLILCKGLILYEGDNMLSILCPRMGCLE